MNQLVSGLSADFVLRQDNAMALRSKSGSHTVPQPGLCRCF
jgi:hypothetical protein